MAVTMSNPENDRSDEILLGDLFRPLVLYRRLIWRGTLAATVIATLLGGLYLVFQPTTWSAAIGFRPLFDGADDGRYPNDLPFSSADITAASVVDHVFASNNLQTHCPVDVFRSGLVVQEQSLALALVNAEFQARLSDVRLTTVDRQRLQDEFTARRAALPRSYSLMFVRPPECASLPRDVVVKVLAEILEGWASESQERRGVLNIRRAVLSPAVFDLHDAANTSLLVKADLIRGAIVRVVTNIAEVEKFPGAELVRGGKEQVAFAEVRARLEDLMQAQLDPLIGMAGRGLGRESVQWLGHALETATTRHRAAEMQAEALRQALREYSGVPSAPAATGKAAAGGSTSSDVQALTPQIDRTFIEGIVELSEANTTFRQEITRRVIDASIEVANRAQVVEHYRGLLASMSDRDAPSMLMDEVSRRLESITAEAKDTTRLFNDIYSEFSKVAFRAGSAMYRVEEPVQVVALRAFSFRRYALLVLGVFLAMPVVLATACLVLFHIRRYVRSALPPAQSAPGATT